MGSYWLSISVVESYWWERCQVGSYWLTLYLAFLIQSGERYSFLANKWEEIPHMHHARQDTTTNNQNKTSAVDPSQFTSASF